MIEFARNIEKKFIEVEQVSKYERLKSIDYKEEADKLIEELNK